MKYECRCMRVHVACVGVSSGTRVKKNRQWCVNAKLLFKHHRLAGKIQKGGSAMLC